MGKRFVSNNTIQALFNLTKPKMSTVDGFTARLDAINTRVNGSATTTSDSGVSSDTTTDETV